MRCRRVACVAVSDGLMLYAADITTADYVTGAFLALDAAEPVDDVWWLSVYGIYRERPCAAAPTMND